MKPIKSALLIITYSLLILFASCKKDVPVTPSSVVQGSSIFYFTGNVGSENVNLQAGVNNYYMYSSYIQDADNVYTFSGNLKQVNSSASGVLITIYDYKTCQVGASADIDSSLNRPSYQFIAPSGGAPVSDEVNFTLSFGNGNLQSFNFDFGDGKSESYSQPINLSSAENSTHIYPFPGSYVPTLIAIYLHGKNSISQSLNLFTGSYTFTTTIGITQNEQVITSDSGYSIGYKLSFAASISGGTQPYSYLWSFGDRATSNLPAPTHTYIAPGNYSVTLTVTDANGILSVADLDATTFGLPFVAKARASFKDTNQGVIANPDAFSNILIQYSGADGDVYSSSKVAQPLASNFKILSYASFKNNENNQSTKELHVLFNCLLEDPSGNRLSITNGDAVISIAYK